MCGAERVTPHSKPPTLTTVLCFRDGDDDGDGDDDDYADGDGDDV